MNNFLILYHYDYIHVYFIFSAILYHQYIFLLFDFIICVHVKKDYQVKKRVSAIEGVCRSVFGTVQHTVRHKQAEPSFVKKLAINTASVHFAIDEIRVVLQAWALIILILYVTLFMTSRAMGLNCAHMQKTYLIKKCYLVDYFMLQTLRFILNVSLIMFRRGIARLIPP